MVFLLVNRLSSFLFAALFDRAARLLHNIRTTLLVLIVVEVQVLCLGQAVYAQAANSPLLAGASLQPIIAAGEANTALLAEQSDLAPVLQQVIVTGKRAGQRRSELAGNSALLSSDELQLVRHTHIAQALARVAGVNFARGSGQEYLPAVRSPVLTGGGACGSVLAAADGVPLRAAGFCNVNELFDAHTEAAQRIEIIRGPAQVNFGSNAVHGVVNIISPSLANASSPAITLEAGPEDFYRTHVSSGNAFDAHNLRADITLAQDRGFRASSGYDQQKITLQHGYETTSKKLGVLNGRSILTYSNLRQQTASYLEGSLAYKDDALRETNDDPNAYRNAQSARFLHELRYSIDEQNLLIVTPYARYAEMDFLMHFLPGQPVESNGQTSVGVQTNYQFSGEQGWTINTGLDVELTDAFLRQTQYGPTQGSAFLVATILQGKQYDYQVYATQASYFVDVDWPLAQDLWLSAGLRYEYMAYDYNNRMLAGRTDEDGAACGFGGCRYSRPADRNDRFNNWSPSVGVRYELAVNHQLYLNASHGFRAPQATELYRLQRDQIAAELDSEEIFGFELGGRGQTATLAYEMNIFAYKKDNVIFRDSDFFNVANGQTTHCGLEVALDYQVRTDLVAGVRGTYAQHKYANNRESGGVKLSGNQLDSAPLHFGTAFLRRSFDLRGQLELEWVHQSRYYTDPENEHRYAGHDYLNLRGQWNFANDWQAGFRLLNVTDVQYAERADYTSFSGDRYFPSAPRSLFVDIEYRWP